MTNPELGEFGQQRPAAKVTLLGLPVDSAGMQFPGDLDSAAARRSAHVVTFVNPNSCYLDQNDPEYVHLLERFDRVLCDGIGLVLAARLRLRKRIPRHAFDTTSVAVPVFAWAAEKRASVVLVGSKPGVAASAASELKSHFAGLNVLATFSGYGDDPLLARGFILDHPSSLVVCGMGAPLQERFLLSLKEAGWVGLGFTCGGFLDQLCESFAYYPRWIDRLNLRFAYRLFREPGRLGKRYLRDYGVFMRRFLFGTPAR